MKLCAVKVCVRAVAPVGSSATISTVPFVSVLAVHFTVAEMVVLEFCVAGLGEAVAEDVNVGGTSGVAAIGVEYGPVPTLLVPETW